MRVDRLYLVTRADLSPGQQAVQAAHALRAFVATHPEADAHWFRTSNTLVLLAVADEQALGELAARAGDRGIPCAPFREPDQANELTAIALGHEARRLCARLPLALTS